MKNNVNIKISIVLAAFCFLIANELKAQHTLGIITDSLGHKKYIRVHTVSTTTPPVETEPTEQPVEQPDTFRVIRPTSVIEKLRMEENMKKQATPPAENQQSGQPK